MMSKILALMVMAAMTCLSLIASEVVSTLSLPYDESAPSDPLRQLDVFAPVQASNAPVMVYIHGGGWKNGDKKSGPIKIKYYTQQGWLFVSMNYRMTPAVMWPTHAQDAGTALAWVYKNIARYGGNPKQIYLMGHSAGAHIASVISTDPVYLASHQLSLSLIAGTIALDTEAYDLGALAGGDKLLSSPYSDTFGASENPKWVSGSPILSIAADKYIPPIAICFSSGTKPSTVEGDNRIKAATAFYNALLKYGVPTLLVDGRFQSDGKSLRSHNQINALFGTNDDTVTINSMSFITKNSLAKQVKP